ncbi:MAG: DNA mismatch repair endonuclease MutL, partial [Clostridia bacterium]
MNKINILSSEIFNRIAAGEVVERPASIVKELVENSIDAGANVISIEIAQGGIKKIKVSDNGCGIYSDDIKSAFLPHATSKIENLCDLESIKTLGFRGEALSSIASIAQVEMISKTKDSCVGTKIEVSGGEISDLTEVAMTYGTTITVNNIFFNVPARAKFIKKPKSEESEITNYVTRLILANPEIQFKYIVDNETKIDYQSGSGLVHAIEILYGREIAKNLIPVQFENNDGIKLFGYVGRPEIAKSNRTYQTLIINGRYIINYMISAAIANAFSDYLMKGKFPFYVLNLEIPFEQVDINVHPSKLEAKFENSNAIFNLFSSVIFKALEKINYTKEIENFVNEVNHEN